MRTTVALDAATRDKLTQLRRQWKLPSVEAVIERLLAGPPPNAQQLFASRRKDVTAALARHGVRRLVAFGSRARGDARAESDLDLAVSLPPSADLFDLALLQQDLAEAFGVPVDVVSLRNLPPRLKSRIAREGVTLVG